VKYSRRWVLSRASIGLWAYWALAAQCDQASTGAKKGAESVVTAIGYANLKMVESPVSASAVKAINWYGNTELAYEKSCEWYGETQGLHPGVDWLVDVGTAVVNPFGQKGSVISVGGSPYSWGAEPNAVALDFGLYIVLFGHLSETLVTVDDAVGPGERVGLSGVGQGTPHLHLEVIRRDLSLGGGGRPGSTRTNPVRLMADQLLSEVGSKEWDSFHPNDQQRWLTPRDQPDIEPGEPFFFPRQC